MAMPDQQRPLGVLAVTGGAGYLGRVVVARAQRRGWTVVAPTSSELDVRRADDVRRWLTEIRAAAVVHTAYRRDDPASIVDGARNVSQGAQHVGARLVHVSTDAVFAGRPEAYTEADEPDPVHDYGRAKAEAERIVNLVVPDAVVVRPSLIVSAGPGSPPSTHEAAALDAIAGRSAMTFFTDEFRCPIRVDDLAAALVDLAAQRDVSGVVHAGGPTRMSRADLARAAARAHGADCSQLRLGVQADLGVKRPANVVLASDRARILGLRRRGPESWSATTRR